MNNLDILLVVPPKQDYLEDKNVGKYEYLGIGYLLSNLKEENKKASGFIDCYNYSYDLNYIVSKVMEFNPKILGITVSFSNSIYSTIEMIKALRDSGYRGHITVGGHGAASCKEKLLNKLDINSICLCEGEQCFSEFVSKFLSGEDYYHINGYWFKINGKIIKNPKIQLCHNLDELQFPVRTNIITGNTLYQDFPSDAIFTIITSRGCPYNCSFCDIKSFYSNSKGTSWRMRSAKNIVDEIE